VFRTFAGRVGSRGVKGASSERTASEHGRYHRDGDSHGRGHAMSCLRPRCGAWPRALPQSLARGACLRRCTWLLLVRATRRRLREIHRMHFPIITATNKITTDHHATINLVGPPPTTKLVSTRHNPTANSHVALDVCDTPPITFFCSFFFINNLLPKPVAKYSHLNSLRAESPNCHRALLAPMNFCRFLERENGDFNKKSKFLNVHQRKNLR
jgi:hypothetical protein